MPDALGHESHAELVTTRPSIGDALAARLLARCEAKADELGCRVSIVVVDESGIPKIVKRRDGASVLSLQTAGDKAYTAAVSELPTDAFFEVVGRSPSLLASIPARPGLAPFGGGVPVTALGVICGAVGVSGSSPEDDAVIARHAVSTVDLTPDRQRA